MLSFAGKADVYQWEEEDDNLTSKLYWRQTFCRETQELSVSCIPQSFTHSLTDVTFRPYENTAYARGISTPKWR